METVLKYDIKPKGYDHSLPLLRMVLVEGKTNFQFL